LDCFWNLDGVDGPSDVLSMWYLCVLLWNMAPSVKSGLPGSAWRCSGGIYAAVVRGMAKVINKGCVTLFAALGRATGLVAVCQEQVQNRLPPLSALAKNVYSCTGKLLSTASFEAPLVLPCTQTKSNGLKHSVKLLFCIDTSWADTGLSTYTAVAVLTKVVAVVMLAS